MAEKISSKDIFSGDLTSKQIKEFEALIKVLERLEEQQKDILKGSAEGLKINAKEYEAVKKNTKAINEFEQAEENLVITNKEQLKVKEQLKRATDEEVKGKLRLQRANKEQKDILKDLLILQDKEAGTLQKINARNRQLRREREKLNLETEKGRLRLKQINKELDINNKRVKENSDKLKQQKLNVGNYSESVKDAISQSGLFSKQMMILNQITGTYKALLKLLRAEKKANTTATTAQATAQSGLNLVIGKGVKALKAMKVALASSGVGAILLALGSFITYLKRSQDGIDGLKIAMAKATAVFNVILDRISIFGQAISKLFSGDFAEAGELVKKAFADIGVEIEADIKLATELQELLNKLRRQEIDFLVEEAQIRQEIAKYRLTAEDETKDINLRISALKSAIQLEEDLYKKQQLLLREGILSDIQSTAGASGRANAEGIFNRVISGGASLNEDELGASQSTLDDVEETNKKIAEYIDAQTTGFKRQKSELTRLNALIKQRDGLNKRDDSVILAPKLKGLGAKETNNKLNEDTSVQEVLCSKAGGVWDRVTKSCILDIDLEIENTEDQFKQYEALLTDIVNEQTEKRISAIDKEIEANERRQEVLQGLASKGIQDSKENLAEEQKQQAELERERERALKRQQRIELGLAVLNSYSNNVDNNVDNPLAKTITDTSVLLSFIQSLPSFYDGTENTGVGGKVDNKGGFNAILHPNERVMTSDQNKPLEGLSNWELSNLGKSYKEGKLNPVMKIDNSEVVNELKQLVNKPTYLGRDYDATENAIVETVISKGRIERNHRKTGKNIF